MIFLLIFSRSVYLHSLCIQYKIENHWLAKGKNSCLVLTIGKKSSRWKEKIKLTSQNSTRQTRQCITTQSRLSGPSLREKKVFLINIYLLEDQYFFLPYSYLYLFFRISLPDFSRAEKRLLRF